MFGQATAINGSIWSSGTFMDAEDTGLTDFDQENRLFAHLGRHSDGQHDFVYTLANATAAGIELDVQPAGPRARGRFPAHSALQADRSLT
jgi:hypothetical protein